MPDTPTRCQRPQCTFHRGLSVDGNGALVVDTYCSAVCREWTEEAVRVAREPFSPEIERQAHQLDLLRQLLNLRTYAHDVRLAVGPNGA